MKTEVHLPDRDGGITTVINWLRITGVNKIIVIDVGYEAEKDYEIKTT